MMGHMYRRIGTHEYESTDDTRSNWDQQIQHGSPPLALLTRAAEELLGDRPLRIGRLCMDILGAVPVAPVAIRAWVSRPGTRITMMTAEMVPLNQSRPVARLTAWALATGDTTDVATDRYPPSVEGPRRPLPPDWWDLAGYVQAIDWRPQPDDPTGAAMFWLSPRGTLVEGEPTTALQRLAMVVDSANGVGQSLDPAKFAFMNTDTVVHVHRIPEGEDFGIRARASIGPDGIGVTTAELFDRSGFVGTSAQTLLIQRL